ncbi:MAG: DUF5655 domain-containing protein [Fimbriimonas sp.]|nr:DUF5655 domain-containing protein [Fimbriimonas sp.]
MLKRPEEQLAEMITNLKDKTGRTLDEWFEVVKAAGHVKHGQIMGFVKSEYGVSHGFANQIALRCVEMLNPASSGVAEDPIDAMFAGPKSAMKPIYDAVLAKIQSFGSDIDLSPKKGYVSVRRSKQFAILQPSTAARLDVGINLKGVEPTGKLEASGSFNAMLSHRVRVASLEDLDDQLVGWLKQAYDAA